MQFSNVYFCWMRSFQGQRSSDFTFGGVLREFPNLVASNLVVCIFCALLRPFALFCLRSFVLICALLRAFACFCVRPRLERPRLGTSLIKILECSSEHENFNQATHQTPIFVGHSEGQD